VSDDHDLRSKLERLASFAGDPPERGLERVAARRRRRLRRRRGAVATAAVLAVLAVGLPLISQGREDTGESIAASETAPPVGTPVEVPPLVEVRCEPAGITVPVASVRAERDGLHIRVVNLLPDATVVQVDGGGWSSGDISVPPGIDLVRQPVPPGELTIGCAIAGEMERRRVDLVDPAGHYTSPGLDCDTEERTTLRDLAIDPVEESLVAGVRQGLGDHLAEGDVLGAPRGYAAQRLSDATDDPVVQVTRDDDVVAFVHVRGEDGVASPPWTTVSRADVCTYALDGAGAPSADAGSATEDGTGDDDVSTDADAGSSADGPSADERSGDAVAAAA
jgi:hypothetical protein